MKTASENFVVWIAIYNDRYILWQNNRTILLKNTM